MGIANCKSCQCLYRGILSAPEFKPMLTIMRISTILCNRSNGLTQVAAVLAAEEPANGALRHFICSEARLKIVYFYENGKPRCWMTE